METDYTVNIEKGLSLDDPHARRRFFFPVDKMEPGDSFFVPLNGEELQTVRSRINIQTYRYGKRNKGARFSIRKEGDGFRCWRTDGWDGTPNNGDDAPIEI